MVADIAGRSSTTRSKSRGFFASSRPRRTPISQGSSRCHEREEEVKQPSSSRWVLSLKGMAANKAEQAEAFAKQLLKKEGKD